MNDTQGTGPRSVDPGTGVPEADAQRAEDGALIRGIDGQDERQQLEDALLGRLDVIESQPLDQRAAGFDQLAEELLSDLQRSDREPGN